VILVRVESEEDAREWMDGERGPVEENFERGITEGARSY